MFSRIRTSIDEEDSGFTLIELLVVMIIIGILAAIAIPTFLTQRKNGHRAALKSDLKNAASALESAAVDKFGDFSLGGTLAANTVLPSGPIEFVATTGDVITVISASSTTYCLQGVNSSLTSAETWKFDKTVGAPVPGTC